MAIRFRCDCGRALTAPETAVGRRGRCPACGAIFTVPAAEPVPVVPLAAEPVQPADDDQFTVVDDAGTPAAPRRRPASLYNTPRRTGSVYIPAQRADFTPAPEPATAVPTGPATRPYRYLFLLLALLPLAWATFRPADHRTIQERVAQTIADHPEAESRYDDLPDPSPKADVLAVLPGDRCEGALLPYDTYGHWALAAASAAGFFGLIVVLFPPGHTKLHHLLAVGAFTGTAGIVLLLAFQWLAFHMPLFRGSGIITLLLDLIWLIGQSYALALGDHGFLVSALGFTAGVGFCEEACKAIPLLFKVRTTGFVSWRSALLWGLISGVGFGVSEGITYSADSYNGVLGGQIYAVRFISCVALHGIWAAAVGIAVYRRRHTFQGRMSVPDWLLATLAVVAVPMVLHGMYDTLLKQSYDAAALAVALASFGWLAYQVELAKRKLDGAEPAARRGSAVMSAGR